jgi:hypothetical protein
VRAIGIVQRHLDLLRTNAERCGLFAIDLDVDLRPGDLQVAGDVDQGRQSPQLRVDDGHPVVQFLGACPLQHVLVGALGKLSADAYGRHILHERLDAEYGRYFRAQLTQDCV